MIFLFALYMMASNALYELEAKGVVESSQFPFSKTPDISLALAELYRDGVTDFFPHMTVPKTDTKKSAYWYIEAAKADNEGAQAYLKTLIPDYEKKLRRKLHRSGQPKNAGRAGGVREITLNFGQSIASWRVLISRLFLGFYITDIIGRRAGV